MFLGTSVAALLLAAAGCSSTDAAVSITVPTPSPQAAAYCRALHKELPRTVAGLDRGDAGPKSELTAEWGDGEIVLRCGVPRPAKMDDPMAKGTEANGVNWLLEQSDDAGPRFTTTYRKAYVEVTLSAAYAHDASPLAAFGPAVRRTVPGL
ncbi:DUF3515 domain-containing protein [Streptomyces sp. NBC_00053]|uniref:DUF3515 domain-containing protein n=1 Tax=unclassified Streptomyces TaxID=2593676 RepID=UPI000F5BEA72|nr:MULTISPECIES: DUF3515 domain-containing protein [unclassified Streptomyces]WSG55983.1 DUF3515 domain-containing protein [Streptomyces sp. NBC_01732]WSW10528.1 DUF3515 domain-containing protein [Streptomyces sp. NBC_01005]WSX07115.1 DUF3515 domain-containing protein [Streptomyces sp. NBC_00987]WTD00034.1 DUF3515 domain-containing protein [Streptomyces sp. NBC_01650]MCX4393624.1 DUF3515 domain-containing protein [Streptomyces sp. NBC_01767]